MSVRVGEEYAAQVVDLPIPASPPDPPTLSFGVLGATDETACDVWFDDIHAY